MVNRLRNQASLSCLLLCARLALQLVTLPFKLAGRVVAFGLTLAGRVVVAGLGLGLIVMGVIAGLTGPGLIIGIPLLLLGSTLVVRSLGG